MAIDKKTVEHVAHLARIELKEDEVGKLSKQLEGILDFIGKLEELDTKNTSPTSHILQISNVLREDIVAKSLTNDMALMNAPSKEGNFFSVPKVIE